MKLLASLFLTLATAASSQAQNYAFAHFSSPLFPYISATGINNKGEIVGTISNSWNWFLAYRYSSGTFYYKPSPGPSKSTWGDAINSAGTIVGVCDRTGSAGSPNHAFYAAAGGNSVDFDNDSSRSSEAVAVVDTGYVVGCLSYPPSTLQQAFLGNINGWIMPLGHTLGRNFVATGLSDSLVVVGNEGERGGLTYNASNGTIRYMGTILGSWDNTAAAINHSNTVAGTVGSKGYVLHSNGAFILFGSTKIAEVRGINGAGDVVGTLFGGRAFVYRHSTGQCVDLNSCIPSTEAATWTLISANGINDSGSICGEASRIATPAEQATYGPYVVHAYKLNPRF